MSDVQGADVVADAFHKAFTTVGKALSEVVENTAGEVVREAQRLVPKRRGQLAKSITYEMVSDLEAEVGPENKLGGGYGHIVEKGLAGKSPRPFLNPALDFSDRRFESAVRAAVRGITE